MKITNLPQPEHDFAELNINRVWSAVQDCFGVPIIRIGPTIFAEPAYNAEQGSAWVVLTQSGWEHVRNELSLFGGARLSLPRHPPGAGSHAFRHRNSNSWIARIEKSQAVKRCSAQVCKT